MVAILAAAIVARFDFYGNPRQSIGSFDTPGYTLSAKAPLFSWRSFAGTRLFTTNMLYKLAVDPSRCRLTAVSLPGMGTHEYRRIQNCFDVIALIQNLLSILGWCFLAWSLSHWLSQYLTKLLAAGLILAFAFTPQIAEWDSLLGTESLTVSLFVISFGLLLEIVNRVTRNPQTLRSGKIILLSAAFFIAYVLWVFVRDVNLYALLITVGLLALLFPIRSFRRSGLLIVLIVLLVGIFILGYSSARASLRATRYPLAHVFETYILPYPTRVAFFTPFGMPDPKASTYQAWLDGQATKTYALFLLAHPGFVVTTIWGNQYYFTTDYTQPYFDLLDVNLEATLYSLGQWFHPETAAIYLIDVVFLLILCYQAILHKEATTLGWAWLASWFFLSSTITLFVSFFGDSGGILRHIYPSVESFRLFFWIFLVLFLDFALVKKIGVSRPDASLREPNQTT